MTTKASPPLTSLSEAQRTQALERFALLRPALEGQISQTQLARDQQIPLSTIQRWIKQYREKGLAGLANARRSDKDTSRRLSAEAITLIEGLALQTPPRSIAAIHRQVVEIAKAQGWKPPSYDNVRQVIKKLAPALVTMAHQGAAAYREKFDLLYRREATHSNAMWQADHCELPILLLNEAGEPDKPYLTAIEDDYSRMIVGYRFSFQASMALTTALALRHAICSKEDPRWHAYGIPSVFYTDHGSDFTGKHMEQVAADLPMELIFSQASIPRGRGKVEQLLLQDLPGYAPKGSTGVKAQLSLPAFEQRFRTWLLEDFHTRIHVETKCKPQERWEAGGFLPRTPKSLEQLDLLLLTVAKTRRVQQDGIRFQGYRYMDPTLAGYVKEEVVIRYDPVDLAVIRVFHQERFVCRAICQELSGQTVSLKEIEKARSLRRKQVRDELSTRAAMVDRFVEIHHRWICLYNSAAPSSIPPPISASVPRIEKQVLALFAAFSYLVEAANQHHQGTEACLVTRRHTPLIELLIVDEANRLKDAGLELMRDFADRGEFGLVLLGMPGLEKRIARAPQLYSRIGFNHEMEPLSDDETRFFLDQRWSHRVSAHSNDFTDQEAVAAILRITRGNLRLIERLMMQVELVLVANQLTVVTKEVVETARKNLIIGPD